ncbi:MAG TPA: SlyX family protein [Gammaproteobacteria bacterium]
MEDKLIDLETRIAFLEEALQQVSDVVARQENEITRLLNRVKILEEQLRQAAPSLVADAEQETPPPHY